MLKRAYIEITNECNLQCSFCPPTIRSIKYMDELLFLSILEQLKGITRYVYFHVKGEPFLHPNLIPKFHVHFLLALKNTISRRI